MSFLVIVESPTKIKSLKKYIPKADFTSSFGHIRDLPESRMGIDTEHKFEVEYEVLAGKEDVVKTIQKLAKKHGEVYLATDPDREGEAIAWHIAHLLPKECKVHRISFNAITRSAVEEAMRHPRQVDLDTVNAQQARRVLDRLVGYKLSPFLQRKVQQGTSAGRVQSVALLLVVQREEAIEAFIPKEFWTIESTLSETKASQPLIATLHSVDGAPVVKELEEGKPGFLIDNQKIAHQMRTLVEKGPFITQSVERKEKMRYAPAPFTTSTLQQDASRSYGFTPSRTMKVAQKLYEGVHVSARDGFEGLITYMRTDSTRVEPSAITQVRSFIEGNYGESFLPEKPLFYKTKSEAQDAHEAIRPTHVDLTPDLVKDDLTIEEFKLYQLIWRRFVASQMKAAIYDSVSYQIKSGERFILKATGSTLKFKGFLELYQDDDEEQDPLKTLPHLEEKSSLFCHKVTASQSFTKPPARFTEASLIKELERSGIGRPSTYAAIMNKILSREYTRKEKLALIPTELGRITANVLLQHFPKVMDAAFTAQMEEQLDEIEEGRLDWITFVAQFWKDFSPTVELAMKEAVVPKVETDLDCPKCGKKLLKIWSGSKGGGKYFYGCSDYPTCDYRSSVELFHFDKSAYDPNFNWDQNCPNCGQPMAIRMGRFGAFLGCTGYPECKTIINIASAEEASQPKVSCPAVECPGHLVQRKSRFGKSFYACSTYPDCDVIGNSIDQVLEKFKNHPRTAAPARPAKTKKTREKKSAPSKKKEGAAKSSASKKSSSKKAPTQGTLIPDSALAAIIGSEPTSRQQATKALWDYIKKENLQDPKNKRTIVPDAKLALVIGKAPIDMMSLAKHLSAHLN